MYMIVIVSFLRVILNAEDLKKTKILELEKRFCQEYNLIPSDFDDVINDILSNNS